MKLCRKTLQVAGLLAILLLLLSPAAAWAQSYYFTVEALTADLFVNEDGTISLLYEFVFNNAPGAHVIDFVDVGMPNSDFSMSGVSAEVNGSPVEVSRGEYQGDGSGFAVVLGNRAIQPGERGTVRVYVPLIEPYLRTDSRDPGYASLNFSPTWFGREFVQGDTQITVSFHMPPGVLPEEPRWHDAPTGFPAEPQTGIDDQGRVVYTWSNLAAQAYKQYGFGASFPSTYVPAGTVVEPTVSESLGIDPSMFSGCLCFSAFGLLAGALTYNGARSVQKRKLQYMPPKIAIEGMGIKRGLTAVEAAILMEQPLDKILTMILFGLVKKNAAEVTSQDPLTIKPIMPAPPEILDYERQFLNAFQLDLSKRKKALQETVTDLIQSVTAKMKGFSRSETVAYYKDIMERAWKQVESGQTPEVKMEAFDKYMEWTMLDKEYDDRTRRVFTGPVIMPTWWPRYDPTYHAPSAGGYTGSSGAPTTQGGSPGGGSFSLPNLPGAAVAASMVRGVQNFSSSVIGNVTDFTSTITNRTNPPPPPPKSSGSRSGGGCACACACAGCACACAGGGR